VLEELGVAFWPQGHHWQHLDSTRLKNLNMKIVKEAIKCRSDMKLQIEHQADIQTKGE
jgi:hypothetical protein